MGIFVWYKVLRWEEWSRVAFKYLLVELINDKNAGFALLFSVLRILCTPIVNKVFLQLSESECVLRVYAR